MTVWNTSNKAMKVTLTETSWRRRSRSSSRSRIKVGSAWTAVQQKTVSGRRPEDDLDVGEGRQRAGDATSELQVRVRGEWRQIDVDLWNYTRYHSPASVVVKTFFRSWDQDRDLNKMNSSVSQHCRRPAGGSCAFTHMLTTSVIRQFYIVVSESLM